MGKKISRSFKYDKNMKHRLYELNSIINGTTAGNIRLAREEKERIKSGQTWNKKLFEEYKGCMDICQVTDDFGQQSGLVMSIDMIREFFWPHYKKAIGLAKEYNLKIFHHDDGGMAEIIPDLIELGVNILNPIQWKCEGMSLELLKKRFGSKICFHGTVENQDILPFGTALEVRKETRKNIDILFKDRTGLIIGPCHSIQSGTPIENVLALFDEAQRYKI